VKGGRGEPTPPRRKARGRAMTRSAGTSDGLAGRPDPDGSAGVANPEPACLAMTALGAAASLFGYRLRQRVAAKA